MAIATILVSGMVILIAGGVQNIPASDVNGCERPQPSGSVMDQCWETAAKPRQSLGSNLLTASRRTELARPGNLSEGAADWTEVHTDRGRARFSSFGIWA